MLRTRMILQVRRQRRSGLKDDVFWSHNSNLLCKWKVCVLKSCDFLSAGLSNTHHTQASWLICQHSVDVMSPKKEKIWAVMRHWLFWKRGSISDRSSEEKNMTHLRQVRKHKWIIFAEFSQNLSRGMEEEGKRTQKYCHSKSLTAALVLKI